MFRQFFAVPALLSALIVPLTADYIEILPEPPRIEGFKGYGFVIHSLGSKPPLKVELGEEQITFRWPFVDSLFLKQSPDLSTGSWTSVTPTPPSGHPSLNTLTVPILQRQFFQLQAN